MFKFVIKLCIYVCKANPKLTYICIYITYTVLLNCRDKNKYIQLLPIPSFTNKISGGVKSTSRSSACPSRLKPAALVAMTVMCIIDVCARLTL